MSDEHDPIDGRIDDGFDRLRSDSQSLDAMAPLRSAHGRRSRLPWGRIVLGGGLIAAVLVFVGMFALGGDEPEEIVAGPGDRPTTATLGIDDDAQPDFTTEDLLGTTWILIEGVGPAGEIAIVSGFEPTFEIGPDGFSGNLSCNAYGYGGSFTPLDDRSADITVTGGFSQLAGCLPEGVMESEERFTAALNEVTLMELQDGLLVLSSSTAELIFRPGPPEFDRVEVPLTETVADIGDRVPGSLPDTLDGTFWVLESGGPELPLPAVWRRHRLELFEDRFLVLGMCSAFGGRFGGDEAPFATSEETNAVADCPIELDELDRGFMNALASVDSGRLEEGKLHLAAAAGDLVFQREVLDERALTGVRWELTGWDLDAAGTARTVESPAHLELGATALVDGRRIGSVSGNSGCVAFGGEWQNADRSILMTVEVTDVDSCPDPLPDQDLQVLEAIGSRAVALFLPGGALHVHSLREPSAVAFEIAEEDAGDPRLDGTAWELIDGMSVGLEPQGFTLSFTENTFSGSAPCNGFGGRYRVDGETLVIIELSKTQRGCERSDEEDVFIATLLRPRVYGIDGGQLIVATDGDPLVFEPRGAVPDAGSLGAVVGTSFELRSWTFRNNSLEATAGITLEVLPGSEFRITTTCVVIEGFYSRTSASVSETDVYRATRSNVTDLPCVDELGQEPSSQDIVDLLVGVTVQVIDGMVIFGEPGIEGLTFG